ncbi:hypothetical protein T484DRAFT_1811430 [Baffinella frigidus]|nr:hypothetical protein T484DRAFT_1811430 [Cryptophyta sp. CCMP2293]
MKGIWPVGSDGSQIFAVDVSRHLKLFRHPCSGDAPIFRSFIGHSSGVTNLTFSEDNLRVLSVGGRDACLFQWRYIPKFPDILPSPASDWDLAALTVKPLREERQLRRRAAVSDRPATVRLLLDPSGAVGLRTRAADEPNKFAGEVSNQVLALLGIDQECVSVVVALLGIDHDRVSVEASEAVHAIVDVSEAVHAIVDVELSAIEDFPAAALAQPYVTALTLAHRLFSEVTAAVASPALRRLPVLRVTAAVASPALRRLPVLRVASSAAVLDLSPPPPDQNKRHGDVKRRPSSEDASKFSRPSSRDDRAPPAGGGDGAGGGEDGGDQGGRIDSRLELEWVMGYGGERNLGNLKLLGRGQLLYSAGAPGLV